MYLENICKLQSHIIVPSPRDQHCTDASSWDSSSHFRIQTNCLMYSLAKSSMCCTKGFSSYNLFATKHCFESSRGQVNWVPPYILKRGAGLYHTGFITNATNMFSSAFYCITMQCIRKARIKIQLKIIQHLAQLLQQAKKSFTWSAKTLHNFQVVCGRPPLETAVWSSTEEISITWFLPCTSMSSSWCSNMNPASCLPELKSCIYISVWCSYAPDVLE